MEDSSAAITLTNDAPVPFGMNSFSRLDQHSFGQNIRLAMACIEGSTAPACNKAMPSDAPAISKRLIALSQDMTSSHADLLELLIRFDELEGWKASGSKHCAAWMNLELGISFNLGWEYLRVGRRLRSLATTTALFRAGKLSWSKVRLISRVADESNERTLCHAALDASVSEVERLCAGYRWLDDEQGSGENEQSLQQWNSRYLRFNKASNGNTHIQIALPPELAQAFLNSIEHSLNQTPESIETDTTLAQRRADAAVLMAEKSLQSAGQDIAAADRYQVIVSVEASQLQNEAKDTQSMSTNLPTKRPTIHGAGPIATETAKRLSCDCSLSSHIVSNAEPVSIGRKSRLWPAAMARAIKNRDQHCQFPGCTQTMNLQIHHIKHWADGGATSITNGVCLCSRHHTIVHEGGYTIQRIDNDRNLIIQQYTEQRHDNDIGQFDSERLLRCNRESFETVRKLEPTRFRFRVIDTHGNDIRKSQHESLNPTRVGCAEPTAQYHASSYSQPHALNYGPPRTRDRLFTAVAYVPA